tara:strand:+ start:187 stop:699 length:513 start_codon:yes stop_codon:yes gene_type:complete
MTSFAFGHALRIKPRDTVDYHYQNFFIGKEITHQSPAERAQSLLGSHYTFVPFGFSGVTVNRTGDGLESTLVFPVNKVSLGWGINAIESTWIMEVDVLIIENSDPDAGLLATNTIVHTYTGQVLGGQWDNTSLNLELGSVLDAVGTDVPRRALTNRIVGNLPVSNNVRLR